MYQSFEQEKYNFLIVLNFDVVLPHERDRISGQCTVVGITDFYCSSKNTNKKKNTSHMSAACEHENPVVFIGVPAFAYIIFSVCRCVAGCQ